VCKRGDFTTLFGTFVDMIAHRLVGRPVAEAPRRLIVLLDRLQTYPGYTDPPPERAPQIAYAAGHLRRDLHRLLRRPAPPTARELGHISAWFVVFRSMFRYTAVDNRRGSRGPSDGAVVGSLRILEKFFRDPRAQHPPGNPIVHAWNAFDFAAAGPKLNAHMLLQHVMQLEDSYPHTFGSAGQFRRHQLLADLENHFPDIRASATFAELERLAEDHPGGYGTIMGTLPVPRDLVEDDVA
jgi:hypothetical protein